ncbi:MAG TPA: hypothetical protein VLG13_02015, partial [Patescibacteria group bacterium]|nr:hypothetical protein [Patescibacteria group bacterium]
TYTPTSSGSGTVTATVTDSVLYSASDSGTLNFTVAPAKQTLTLNLNGHTNTGATFSWNSITGATSYKLCVSGPSVNTCQNISGTSGTITGFYQSGKTYSATVTANDSDNTASDPVTWKA